MKSSYGILLASRGRYFLCHTTRPYRQVNKYDGWWTIPKGGPEVGETEEATAFREFLEEAGIDLRQLGLTISPLTTYQTKSKRVHVFLCEDKDGLTIDRKSVV